MNWTNDYKNHSVKHFLPCLINDEFQILGVWTHKNNSPNFENIGQFWKHPPLIKAFKENKQKKSRFRIN
jgi:hypothetical protein